MKRFDAMTPIGILAGFAAVSFAILNNSGFAGVIHFIHLSSVLIVGGGLMAAILINFSVPELKLLPKVFKEAFREDRQNLFQLTTIFVELSTKARKEGLLALEDTLEDIQDPFIKKGVMLAIDGIEPEVIKDIMMAEVFALEERHRKGRAIIEKCGEYAPAWGMIGTLIGLVLMLQNLSNVDSLGPSMAVALITTLYGSLLANLVFIPIGSKLANKTEEELFVKQIIIEGVVGVQSGQNPNILKEKLSAFLPETKREEEENKGKEKAK